MGGCCLNCKHGDAHGALPSVSSSYRNQTRDRPAANSTLLPEAAKTRRKRNKSCGRMSFPTPQVKFYTPTDLWHLWMNQSASYSLGAPLDHFAPLGSTSMKALRACRYPRSMRFCLGIMTRPWPTALPAIGLFTEKRSGGSLRT